LGINPNIKGYVYNPFDVGSPKIHDSCTTNAFGKGEEDVKEVYCNDEGMFDTKFVVCRNGCENGECIADFSNNQKDMSKYSDKEIFLISDKNWKDVLPLVPITTWTGNEDCQEGYGTPGNVCVYPTLIYHEEEIIEKKSLFNFNITHYHAIKLDIETYNGEIYTGLLYSNGTDFLGTGVNEESKIVVTNETSVFINSTEGDRFFVATHSQENASTILRLRYFRNTLGYFDDQIKFENLATRDIEWTIISSEGNGQMSFYLGERFVSCSFTYGGGNL